MSWQFLALVGALLLVSNAITGALFFHVGKVRGQLKEREAFAAAMSDELARFRADRETKPPKRSKHNDD